MKTEYETGISPGVCTVSIGSVSPGLCTVSIGSVSPGLCTVSIGSVSPGLCTVSIGSVSRTCPFNDLCQESSYWVELGRIGCVYARL